jgi:hypothetical protein
MHQIEQGRLPILAKKNFSKREQIHYDFMMKLFGTSLNLEKAERSMVHSQKRERDTLFRHQPLSRKRESELLRGNTLGDYDAVLFTEGFP